MTLEREYQEYLSAKPRLLADGHHGKWVLVHCDFFKPAEVSIHEQWKEALNQGYERYYPNAFMVRRLAKVEPLYDERLNLIRGECGFPASAGITRKVG